MTKSHEEILAENEKLSVENEELRRSLGESQELLHAISRGEVDALVVSRPGGDQVFTLEGADRAYRVLIEAMNEGAVTTNSEGTILYCNRRFAEMVKFSLEKVIGSSIYQFIPQADQAEFRALLQKPGRVELTIRAEDESILPVYISINSIKLSESDKAFCVVVTDLTEQKHKDEIVAAEKLARSIIEQATEAVVVCDESGKIIRFSKAVSRILGFDPAFQSFEDIFDLRLPIVKKLSPVSAALRGEFLLQVEASFERRDGMLFHLFLNAGPLKSANGKIIGCVVTLADITERKRIEEALLKAKDELELRVQERTADLTNAKEELECTNEELRLEIEEHNRTEIALLEAKDAAEAAAQAKSDFMANMSHEIRTPMNAVIGMTSLLLDDGIPNPEHREFIETIRMSGDALMVIINDILDFSKMQEDLVILEDQPFELAKCVEEALDLVAGKASEKGLNLAYTIDKSVPNVVIGDPNRLRQILSNLLSNAVKFTERGEIKLSASAQKLNGTHEIRFAVQDTGIGISQDQMDHLFVPFSQVDVSVTRNYGGTGLGLVISKKLVELMGGEIWVMSMLGKGSTFYFTIKAETAPGDPEMLVEDQPQLVGKHVLIVSDNRTNRRILGGYIYSWGMVPLVAAKTKDAQNWIQRGDTFDVAILDADMPEMDGLAFADEIRRHNKTLPLVILTQIGQHLPTNHAYLTKPVTPSQLHRVLTNIISMQLAQKSEQTRAVDKEIQTSSLRILLAEDNVTSQKVAKQMLRRLGYRADVVANGIEALQALERQPYDLVLMDLRMPEMDGLQATRIIRQRWPDNGPKIIAITAYALQGDKEKCIDAGMDDYISKPIRMNELAAILELKKFAEDS
jgi:PAS domain S-box-containing protein